jgi:hypothetical protein
MWVGSDSRAKLATPFIQIVTGIQTAYLNMLLLQMLTSVEVL